jgi:hypothetical protein
MAIASATQSGAKELGISFKEMQGCFVSLSMTISLSP